MEYNKDLRIETLERQIQSLKILNDSNITSMFNIQLHTLTGIYDALDTLIKSREYSINKIKYVPTTQLKWDLKSLRAKGIKAHKETIIKLKS